MQSFVCPECGHESTFDPWVESAQCPKCGSAPSPENPIRVERLEAGQPCKLVRRAVRCRVCGWELLGPTQRRAVITHCPKCGSADVLNTFVWAPPDRAFWATLACGTLALLAVLALATRLGWSESVGRCVGPLIGAGVAMAVWLWRVRRHVRSRTRATSDHRVHISLKPSDSWEQEFDEE